MIQQVRSTEAIATKKRNGTGKTLNHTVCKMGVITSSVFAIKIVKVNLRIIHLHLLVDGIYPIPSHPR